MRFRRNESFRYTFNTPVECHFKIIKINGIPVESEFGSGKIMDISPHGLKMMSFLNLLVANKKLKLEVHFMLEEYFFQIPGEVVWQQKIFQNNSYLYGIQFHHIEEISEKIIEIIKTHVRKTVNPEIGESRYEKNQHEESSDKGIFFTKNK